MANFIEVKDKDDNWLLNLDSISRVFINESTIDEFTDGGCYVMFTGSDEKISINITYQKMKELLGLK